jgi:dolichyl-phosphate-mannose-protein mannosyltransferase
MGAGWKIAAAAARAGARPMARAAWHRIAGMNRRSRIATTAALLFLLTLAFVLVGIGTPAKLYFDEVHYVPAARAILHAGTDPNAEHPPLAKELIAAGIAIFGDDPLGWRVAGAIFAALALVGTYLWSLALFESERPALWACAVTLLDQVFYVQARIAMLDMFAVAFCIWALATFTASWLPAMSGRTTPLLVVTGICLGLAAASKWIGILEWLLILAIVIAVKILQGWRTRFADESDSDWYRPDLWADVDMRHWLLCLGLVPVLVYWATFAPLGWHALLPGNFLAAQVKMWAENATLAGTHPYLSGWLDWPVIVRPIWYFFAGAHWNTSAANAEAVLFLGNPAVFWFGLAAIVVALHGWLARRRRDAFLIVAAYFGLYLPWAVLPRNLEFAFYYFPAAMILGPALAFAWYRTDLARWRWARHSFLALCLVLFAYFLPISSAPVHVSEAGYNRLMWFPRWR